MPALRIRRIEWWCRDILTSNASKKYLFEHVFVFCLGLPVPERPCAGGLHDAVSRWKVGDFESLNFLDEKKMTQHASDKWVEGKAFYPWFKWTPCNLQVCCCHLKETQNDKWTKKPPTRVPWKVPTKLLTGIPKPFSQDMEDVHWDLIK